MDEPESDQERWAEQEARFCDTMVETLLASAKGWYEKGVSLYGQSNAQMAAECMIRADTWRQLGDYLRQPRRMRQERAQYQSGI